MHYPAAADSGLAYRRVRATLYMCKSPRQMQLTNALCRYVELAVVVGEGG
jgi:hypothetical protein